MKRITLETLETLKSAETRKSTSQVVAEYRDRVTVCPDAKNYRKQAIKVKTASDYYQKKYQRGV
jgi:hypothetical protein